MNRDGLAGTQTPLFNVYANSMSAALRRELHPSVALIVANFVAWGVSSAASIYYTVRGPSDGIGMAFWYQNAVFGTSFTLQPQITQIYWYGETGWHTTFSLN